MNELVSLRENSNFSGGMLYIEPKYKVSFIEKELKLLSLPHEESYVLRIIQPNALVQINDLVEVKGKRWLNVTAPVYDTPMDFKGWIKRSQSTRSFKEKDNRSPEENELIKVRKQNQQLRMENDILKQAALILGRR